MELLDHHTVYQLFFDMACHHQPQNRSCFDFNSYSPPVIFDTMQQLSLVLKGRESILFFRKIEQKNPRHIRVNSFGQKVAI